MGLYEKPRNWEKYLFDFDNNFHQYIALTFDYSGYSEYLENLGTMKARDKSWSFLGKI